MRTVPTLAVVASLLTAHAIFAANPIQIENAKPGNPEWQLTTEASGQIEGYASATSINHGETINIYVNTTDPSYLLEVYRMGWYGGAGARRVFGPVSVPGVRQTIPPPDPTTGIVECHWTNPYAIVSGADWTTGIYLVKLTAGTTGVQKFVKFVVRDDASTANHYFQDAVTTAEAYNNWGGKSLYGFNSSNSQPAVKVSFDRPFVDGAGTGTFLWQWEYNMVRFLEREGYDVAYCTNIDTARRGTLLLRHKSFVVVGHDEYWSWDMRTNVESARTNHVNLAFFAANTCYWQIRLEANSSGTADRTIVGYKEQALTKDPFALDRTRTNDNLITTNWRASPVNDPESKLVGVMYGYDPVNADIVIDNVTGAPWVFAGTGLTTGSHLPGLLGYEVDAISTGSPTNIIRLGHSPYQNTSVNPPVTNYSDMTVYTGSGATVFATGSIQWAWGVDSWNAGATLVNPAAQRVTENVLHQFAGTAAANDCLYTISPATAAVSAAAGSSTLSVTTTPFCSWTATSNAAWLTITAGASGTGKGTVTYSFAQNAGPTRTAAITIADKTFTITQAACTYTLSKTADSFTAAGGTDSIAVTAPAGCAWTASSNQTWLTVTSGASGSGNGSVAFSVAATAGPARDATLTIGGIAVAVHQASGCTYTLAPTTVTEPAAGAADSVALTTSDAACAWTATPSAAWVTVTSPLTGTGNATINFTVAANTAPQRQSALTVGTATVTINQSNGCTYSVSPATLTFDSAGGSQPVTVTPSSGACFWSSQANNAWLTLTGGDGQGTATVTVTAAANTAASRNGSVTIAGKLVTVAQAAAPCTYSISPASNPSVPRDGGTFAVAVTASSWCNWTATTTDAFLHVTSGASGTGNGSVTYSVDANTGAQRGGTLTIAGQTFSVTQAACVPASIATQPASTTITSGDSATLSVTAAGSTPITYQWFSGTTAIAGATSATLTVTPSATTSYFVRVTNGCGTIDSATATVTVNPCAYATAPSSFTFDASGGSGSVSITTGANCYWTSSSGAAWITITGGANGHANSATTFTIAANTTTSSRTSYLIVAGNTIVVNQNGQCVPPSISAQPQSSNITPGSSATLSVTAGGTAPLSYQWYSGTTAISGATAATLTVSPSSTTSYFVRVTNACGTIDSATATVTVTPCSYSVSPASLAFDASGGPGSVTVTTVGNCAWTASTTTPWITINSGASGSGNGSTAFTVAANTTSSSRGGSLTAAGTTVTITQAAPCAPPAITTQPQSTTTAPGAPVTLSVGNSGSAPINYQWYSGTTAISGATSASLTVSPAATTSYFVRVSNACGTIDSATATVTVCSFTASPASFSFDTVGGTGSITVTSSAGCAWSATTTTPWITINSGASGGGNGTVGFTAAANTGAARTGTLTVAGVTVTVNQAACSTPAIGTQPQSTTIMAGSSATLTVAATGTTPLSYQWFTGTTAIAGATAASLTVTPTATTSYFVRITNACGTADSAAATVTVCSFAANPTSFTFDTSGGSGTITVTSSAGCTWTATTTTPWITINSGASGSGNGTVSFSVAANSGASRSGTLTVAGVTISVTQSACTAAAISAQPQSTSITSGGSATLSVTASGTAPLSYQWFNGTTPISGATSSSLTVSPTATTSYFVRVTNACGTIDSATATVTVCSYTVTPADIAFDTNGGSGSVAVTTTGGCAWSSSTATPWIAITSGANGSGNGTVAFTVAANSGAARTGTLTVAGVTVNVTQSACTAAAITTQPQPASITAGESATLSVVASGSAPLQYQWYSGTTPVAGATAASLTVSPSATTSYFVRLTNGCGTIDSSTVTVTVTPCTYRVSAGSMVVSASGGGASVAVSTTASCGWSAASNTPWITITGGASGTGNGVTTFTIAPNTDTNSRFGSITIAGDNVMIHQTGSCAPAAITAQPQAASIAAGDSATLSVSVTGSEPLTFQWYSGASGDTSNPIADATAASITVTPAATTSYWVAIANACGNANSEAATVTVGCTLSASPTSFTFDASGGTATVNVTGGTGCAWSASTASPWITITSGASGTGNGTTAFSIAPNDGAARTGTLIVAGTTVTISQSARVVQLTAPGGVVAAAATPTSVSITWTPVTGATAYHVYRSADHLTFALVGTATGTSLTDTASANTAYLYKVRAFDGTSESPDSNLDLATTVIFTDATLAGKMIRGVHFAELRTAVAAVRSLAGLTPFAFTDPTLDHSVPVKAIHMMELRSALDAARSALGMPPLAYTDANIVAGQTILKSVHIVELRAAVQ